MPFYEEISSSNITTNQSDVVSSLVSKTTSNFFPSHIDYRRKSVTSSA